MTDPRVISLLDEALKLLRQDVSVPPVVVVAAPVTPLPGAFPEAAFDDYGKLFDFLRGNTMLGPKITASEFEGTDQVIRACWAAKWSISWTAYALATAYHETAHTMQPIKEMGGPAYFTRMYDIQGNRPKKARELGNLTPGDGARYPGRGYVQLTGLVNYRKATAELRARGFDVDLVANPDLAMRPDVAAAVMVIGMEHGWFTARKLADDLPRSGPATRKAFVDSRDIINGSDRADLIAGYAVDWQKGLQQGGYRQAA